MRGNDFVWLAGGMGLGAGCTYLFATRQGRRLRRNMYRKAEDCRDRMVSAGEDLLHNGKSLLDRSRAFGDDMREFLGRTSRVFQR